MIDRRFLLKAGATAMLSLTAGQTAAAIEKSGRLLAPIMDNESLPAYLKRTLTESDPTAYARWLGAANDYKEGDGIVGVAAPDEATRQLARRLLANTTIAEIDANAPHHDQVLSLIEATTDADLRTRLKHMTLGQLKTFVLTRPEAEIHTLRLGLSSDVIASLVRLMNNDELITVGAKVFNPLPGSAIGAKGYMGARVQPNSPTDDPEDIRWQVFDAFAYGVGDVVLGTNPVSSEPESIAAIQQTLKDVLDTFELDAHIPHCVLSHIDVQAEVERDAPGLTDLWFQSIAGNDEANETFDVSVEKMRQYAAERTGTYGLYFETGQGADFTNGHGYGVDMVTYESRKYGFARALTLDVQRVSKGEAWVHLNDVAGFIGPEVFRTREQLVRCCLEDIVMGKLHGLCIGLDICATLHMSVSLDDLDWCIDQVMPANPAYLMALPTKIDPMLGYLTTGYLDHVRIREKFGYQVNDPMWQFFQRLDVIDSQGNPGANFGDPIAVYFAYRRAKGDQRPEGQLRDEANQQLSAIRNRGVFIAEGHGDRIFDLEPALDSKVRGITEEARACIWEQFDEPFRAKWSAGVFVATQSTDREDYILHPDSGESLSPQSVAQLTQWDNAANDYDAIIVISDGLNARALKQQDQLEVLVAELRKGISGAGMKVAEQNILVESGRVRAGYRIGEQLFKSKQGPRNVFHIVGERPGTGHNTLSVYLTRADASDWSTPNTVDHNITRVVSGIARTTLQPEKAARDVMQIHRTLA
jgi:ethanolamine ammonia-lyase large subunit|tara:strand:- start:507 stop:2774 length:2268 start_codon:yes stop_codon:yes gene_type:complete